MSLLLLAACGGTPKQPSEPLPPPPPAYTDVPDALALATVRLDRLPKLAAKLERGLGSEGETAEAWRALRQRLEDALDDLAMGELSAAEGNEAPSKGWGLRRTTPIGITLGAVGGKPMAQTLSTLIQVLAGDPPPALASLGTQGAVDATLADVPPAVWHARVTLGVAQSTTLQRALTAVAQRLGWSPYAVGAPPPEWASAVPWPADTLWAAYNDESGHLVVARVRDTHGAIDVVAAATPAVKPEALLPLALRTGERWPRGEKAMALSLRPEAIAPLEAAIDGHLGLLNATRLEGTQRLEVLQAIAGLTAACAGLWQRLSRVARQIDLTLDVDNAGINLEGEVKLTARGRRAWQAVVVPPIFGQQASAKAPAGFQITAGRVPFVERIKLADMPETPERLIDEISGCGAGHPALSSVLMLAVLPAVVGPEALPVPQPDSGPLAGSHPEAQGAVFLGFQNHDGEPVPRVGAVAIGPDGAIPPDGEPLGSEARLEMTPVGPRWTLDNGGLPIGYLRQPRGRGRTAVMMTFGTEALKAMEGIIVEPVAPGPRRMFLEAWLKPGDLARSLEQTDSLSVDASPLRGIEARLGSIHLSGHLEGDRLIYMLKVGKTASVTATLDHRRGAY